MPLPGFRVSHRASNSYAILPKETKEPASKPLDELRGAMLDGAVTAFEKARAKMNSAVRPL